MDSGGLTMDMAPPIITDTRAELTTATGPVFTDTRAVSMDTRRSLLRPSVTLNAKPRAICGAFYLQEEN